MSDEPLLLDLSARAIGLLLQASVIARFRVRVRGLGNFTRSPSTLIVFSHRRDSDIEISVSTLYGGRDYFLPHRTKPSFVAREDMFRPGFLANYLTAWPWPLRRLFAGFNLKPVFVPLHAYPMRRVAERTLGEVLEDSLDLFGDLPLSQVVKPEWVARFEAAVPGRPKPGSLTLKDVLKERYRPILATQHGLLRITHEHFRRMRPHEQRVIEAQLQRFVDLLDQGEILQMAPEGVVSTDGRFSPIRAGLHVLLNRPKADVRVLPLGISYDPFDLGRTRVFVNVGKELLGLKGLDPVETSARVGRAILSLSTITFSHLASQFLVETAAAGGRVIGDMELEAYVASEARHWARLGVPVDPRLFSPAARQARQARYLEYGLRCGTFSRLRGGRYQVIPLDGPEPIESRREPERAILFVVNQLVSMAGVFGTTLSPGALALVEGNHKADEAAPSVV